MKNGFLQKHRPSRTLRTFSFFFLILTGFSPATGAQAGEPEEIEVPKKLLKKLKSFEPSAALYLSDSDMYLIASDDTTEDDAAMLFLMSADGKVEKEPVMFDGVETMTDIESLSAEGDYIYALSSQSRNKKGKELTERNHFARSLLSGSELKGSESVELRPLLLKALGQTRDSRLQAMKSKFNQELEVEASFVREGNLFVGLKDPQPRPGVALVLDLGSVDSIFNGDKLNIKVAHEIDFGGEHKLADMIVANDKLLLASTMEEGGGNIWAFDESKGSLRELQSYAELKPEGISMGKENGDLLVVFDEGEDTAQFARERF